MGATTYLVPPIAILLSWAILSETPEVLALLGGAFCLVGVVIARRPPRPSRAAEAELRGSTRTKLQSADQGG
jgi:drug/metabolite transporter (DMT)-like permease